MKKQTFIAEVAITDLTKEYSKREVKFEKWLCYRNKYNEIVKIHQI